MIHTSNFLKLVGVFKFFFAKLFFYNPKLILNKSWINPKKKLQEGNSKKVWFNLQKKINK